MAIESWGRAVAELKGRCALCLFVVITGCTSTTTTQTVSSPVAERRTRVEQSGSVVTSQWMFEGSQITGHVNWATCLSQRSWTTEEQRTVRRNPIPLAGWGLVVGGLALGGVGVASRDSSPPEGACPTDPVAYNLQMLYGPHCGASPETRRPISKSSRAPWLSLRVSASWR